jgi:hypothetical protein
LTRAGLVELDACPACPDGNLVGFIGGTTNSGTLTFTNINVQTAGTYRMRISYINGGATRTDDITVNEAAPISTSFPGNGSWTVPQDLTIPITLHAGTNTIQFSNATGWAASISTITI